MKKLAGWMAFVAGAVLLTASGAWAQDAGEGHGQATETESNFARDRNVSVRQRPRPDYEAPGIRAGGFLVYPRLNGTVTRDDNIYASQNAKVSDTIFQVVPEIAVSSNWSRHALNLFARGVFNRYANNNTEDTTDFAAGASSRIDIVRGSSLSDGVNYTWASEPRSAPTAPTASVKPIRYALWQANFGGVHEFNRLRLSGRVNFSDFNYQNSLTRAGAPLLQNDRDRKVWTENGRAEYAVSPATSLYVSGTINQRQYRLKPPASAFDKNSSGYDVAVGANFDLTHLARGEIQVGYMSQSYKDVRFSDINGLALKAAVDWFPTELATVNVTASRTIEEASVANASGYLSTALGARVDYELLRNVLLNVEAGYSHDDYRGVDRLDKRTTAGLGATYLMNRHIGLSVGYNYLNTNSTGAASSPSYKDNKVFASLTAQF